jgi:hypothetical protein
MSRLLRIALAAALATGLIGLAGCKINETDLGDIDEGQSFELGELRWNALYDRFINPQQVEDRDYVGQLGPAPASKAYFGVFVVVKNLSGDDQPLPDSDGFKITDTTGAEFSPVTTQGPYEFPYGGTVSGDGTVPDPDSVAANGPVQGSLVLFELDQDVTESRPLEFHITSGGEEAVVKLDL